MMGAVLAFSPITIIMVSSPSFADAIADTLNMLFSPLFIWFIFTIFLVLAARLLWLSWCIGGLLVEYVHPPDLRACGSDFLALQARRSVAMNLPPAPFTSVFPAQCVPHCYQQSRPLTVLQD